MIRYFILSLIISLHFSTIACMGANQYRLFPLGTLKENVIAMAIEIERGHLQIIPPHLASPNLLSSDTEKIDFSENLTAIISLIEINTQNVILNQEGIDTFIFLPPEEMDLRLQEMMLFLLETQQKTKGFKALTTESLLFCNFKSTCSLASVEMQPNIQSLQIRLANGKVYPINTPDDTASPIHPFYIYIDERLGESMPEAEFEYPLAELLFINSVRYFKQGKKRWVVLHITQGELVYDYDNDHVNEDFPYNEGIDTSFPSLQKSYFSEPILWHANGFDWVIFLEE